MPFFQDAPGNPDLFLTDPALRAELTRRLPAALLAIAQERGAAIGVASTDELPRLAAQAEAEPPRLVAYDPWGRRVDEIHTSPAWEALRVFSARHGLVASGYEEGLGEHRRVVQAGMLYLFSASSATYSCPLAMTDAAARVLLDLAPAGLRDRLVAGLTSTDPARFITSGQWMTERTGGSDVGESETIARPAGVVDGERRYTLHGVKWFTSATTSEMALTLARIDDGETAPTPGSRGLSLFCVEIVREPGRGWRGIAVNRLKDKLGTKALPTAELTLEGAPATLIGEPGRGVNIDSGVPLPSQLSRFTRDGCSALAAIPSSVCRCRSAWNVSTATGTGPPLASPNGPDSYMPGPPSNDNEQADSSSCLPSAAYAVGITYRSSYFASANKRYI